MSLQRLIDLGGVLTFLSWIYCFLMVLYLLLQHYY